VDDHESDYKNGYPTLILLYNHLVSKRGRANAQIMTGGVDFTRVRAVQSKKRYKQCHIPHERTNEQCQIAKVIDYDSRINKLFTPNTFQLWCFLWQIRVDSIAYCHKYIKGNMYVKLYK
jgi:hypothetical protein